MAHCELFAIFTMVRRCDEEVHNGTRWLGAHVARPVKNTDCLVECWYEIPQ